jgi:hypothetical protein
MYRLAGRLQKRQQLHGIWQALGAVQGREMVDDRIQHYYAEWPIFQPIIQVSQAGREKIRSGDSACVVGR